MASTKRGASTKAGPAGATRGSAGFDAVVAALTREGGIDPPAPASARRGFGAGALKVNGKIFAMPVDGALVLKLPRSRVDALVASGAGTRFDPGHGRVMKEWLSLSGPAERWVELAREARDFVRGG